MLRSRRRYLARVVAVVMVLAPAVAIRPLLAQGTVEGIASQLICLCGCGKLLSVCEMDTAKQMKSIISDRLAEGMTAREVIDYMTEKYGEQVLAAPTKKGFNLTAWITPFAGIFVGSLVIWLVVAAWVQRRRVVRATEVATVVSEDLESRYGTILEQELDEFEA